MKTAFYSWQSDLPNNTNRSFIESALSVALKELSKDTELIEAERNGEITLDKDTEGVPGTPPITQTILNKISKCSVFVPDVSFVGQTNKGKMVPNANVMIEYGWALRSLTGDRIVSVMNTAFGDPEEHKLPFDLQHLRWPIRYKISGNENAEDRKKEKQRFKSALLKELKAVLIQNSNLEPVQSLFEPSKHTHSSSCFLEEGESLGNVQFFNQEIVIPSNEHMYLRLHPTYKVEPFASSKAVYDALRVGKLAPFRFRIKGPSDGRNRHGAFVVDHDGDKALGVTQLMTTKELWGIDTYTIDKSYMLENTEYRYGILQSSWIEPAFVNTLKNYLRFFQEHLHLKPPFKCEAGLTNVRGFKIAPPESMQEGVRSMPHFGEVVTENIIWKGEIGGYEEDSIDILHPFFNLIWEEAGKERPDKDIL